MKSRGSLIAIIVGVGLAIFGMSNITRTAGQGYAASQLQQKFSMVSGGQSVNLSLPVVGQPVQILIATAPTEMPTRCHGSLKIGPGVGGGTAFKDGATGL